jgi:hypothetical protein
VPSVRSFSRRAFAGSSSTVSRPSGTQAGDVLIAIHGADQGSAADMTISGGWTLVRSQEGFTDAWAGSRVWRRVATASEPSSYTVNQASGADGVVIVVALTEATATGIVVTADGAEEFTNEVAAPAATPPKAGCLALRWAGGTPFLPGDDVFWDYPPGHTPITQAQSGLFASAALAVRSLSTNTPIGSANFFVIPAIHVWQSFTIIVPPSTSSGPTPPPAPPPTIPAIDSSEQVVHYRYDFCDLLTDDLIANDLDLREVTYERRIGEHGPFSATVDITDEITAAKVARILPRHPEDLSSGPGRTLVHVYRNGVVWGSYILWSAEVSWSGRGQPIQVRLEGASLESYLLRVKIRSDLGPYEDEDQIQIARNLLDNMQSTPRYDIGLVLTSGLSGVTQNRHYLASEASTIGERLQELADVDDGFEWTIIVVDNGDGTRTRQWVWGYPQLGSDATSHKFLQPGNVLSWSESIDVRGGTAFQARGQAESDDASEETQAPVSDVVLAQAHLDAGWPGIDVTTDHSNVSDTSVLTAYATWGATHRAGATRLHQATVRLPAATTFGPGNLGDRVTLMLVNPWWPVVDGVASFAKSWRVVGMSFKPPSKGSDIEECVLTFEEGEEE